jgi:hypothetical protein
MGRFQRRIKPQSHKELKARFFLEIIFIYRLPSALAMAGWISIEP